jgi:hypothetical protein
MKQCIPIYVRANGLGNKYRSFVSTAMAVGISMATVALGGGYVILGYGYPVLFALGAPVAALIFGAYFRKSRGQLPLVPAEACLE